VSGIEAMPDTTLRASIFQRPRTTLAAPGRRTRTHEVDPRLAAYRIGGAATPGAGLVGFDGGFDGGGVGGGDGGG
jgi:hypothetical protein